MGLGHYHSITPQTHTPHYYKQRLGVLKEVTGLADDALAWQLLDKHGGDVQAAIHDYLSVSTGGIELPSSSSSSSGTGGTGGTGVRRRSISPGSERRLRARGAAGGPAMAAGDPSLDDSLAANHALSGAEVGEDEAPLLGAAAAAGGQPAAAAGPAAGGGGGGGVASIVALPFKLAGALLRTALAPVRYLAGAEEDDGSGDPAGAARAFVAAFEREYGVAGGAGAGPLRFLPVPFQEATRAAAREGRLLLAYIHAPLHEDTPGFVRGVLRAEGMGALEKTSLMCILMVMYCVYILTGAPQNPALIHHKHKKHARTRT